MLGSSGATTSWIRSCSSETVSTPVALPPMTTKVGFERGDFAAGEGGLLIALDNPVAELLRRPDARRADDVLLDTRDAEVGRFAA